MLANWIGILLGGFLAGQVSRRLGAPALIGMILWGILLGPQVSQWLSPALLEQASSWRTLAVMVILVKAGLGLDREKLAQQGSVALRLGILPAACEALVVAIAAHYLLNFDWLTGLLLGCVIGAESPAVIVPGMLRLKQLGLGVRKGIPDAILTGSALSDVLLLLVFSLLLALLTPGDGQGWTLPGLGQINPWILLPIQVLLQVGLGAVLGFVAARLLVRMLGQQRWTQTLTQDTLVTAAIALGLVLAAERLPIFSGYLAVMALGYFVVELDAPLARRLRQGFDSLWAIAQIALFVLLGAGLPLTALVQLWQPGLLILLLGTLVGRSLGWALSTWGSNWNWRERSFLLAGNSAKATVQAAIGGVPLAAGLPEGQSILAIAVLSIVLTAPLGAWAIPTFAPRLLSRDPVDPTQVSRDRPVRLLAAVDTSPLAIAVLLKAAELARRSEAEVVILHVAQASDDRSLLALQEQIQRSLADIRHQFWLREGAIPETIDRCAQDWGADEIILGKHEQPHLPEVRLGSVSQTLLDVSTIPVILVEPVAADQTS
ncbi:cation:proton antiporter [Synechococcus elongatus]|uniref:Cation:proton antiporter n=1 Tax=Synechococcus elongatus PCC 11801 TaxID=2219813 RepID=A0AAN1QMV7_SYNEL|nr:cation:proton antiporter [Synechococcus elongatus]AZB72224.1 sodium:proton antiporter [Synechococcus elongatus PCC 11801]